MGYVQKTAQKQPKIVPSAGMKTFEISKLENYKSDVNETWPRYVPAEYLWYNKNEGVNKKQKTTKNAMKLRGTWL